MWRRAAITDAGLFDETLQVGEEPDLCYRVRQRGGRILCLDDAMVTHDLGMHRFSQYWRRSIASGRAYASIAMRFRRDPERMWMRETLVNFAEPALWLLIVLVGWQLFGGAVALTLLLAWWVLRACQVAYTLRNRNLAALTAVMYGIHCQFARLPAAIGQAKALMSTRRPHSTRSN
jgi:hypothetical protein